jgi:hypothetical protein
MKTRFAFLVIVALVVSAGPVVEAKSKSKPTYYMLSGYVVELGCVPTAYSSSDGSFECLGRAIVTDSWSGTIESVAKGTSEIGKGNVWGTTVQKFDGKTPDGHQGQITMRGWFEIDGQTGKEIVTSTIVKGSGAFKGSKGSVIFRLQNPLSAGPAVGSYYGKWTHPAFK